MSKVLLPKNNMNGNIKVPTSKSDLHRAIICAALSRGACTIHPVDLNEDVYATIEAIKILGAKVKFSINSLHIDSTELESPTIPYDLKINCGESGSTLRFMIPVVSALGYKARFEGRGRLSRRPLDIYFDLLPASGVTFLVKHSASLPFHMAGQLSPGTYEMPGDVSSQFISGFLMALPVLNGDSKIILTTPLESKRYVDMTIRTMNFFGVDVEILENGFSVKGNQKYKPCDYSVESDWSQAAFFIAAGALGGNITVEGLNPNSIQGDHLAYDIIKEFGANLEWMDDKRLSCRPGELKGINIDATHIPDLVPVLAVIGAAAQGKTVITGAKRLRLKESDRLKAMKNNLLKIGANVVEIEDGLILEGVKFFTGQRVNSYNDHRIAMAMTIAALKLHPKNSIELENSEAINKSYPTFYEHVVSLGGIVNAI